jgi:hypothetical protein
MRRSKRPGGAPARSTCTEPAPTVAGNRVGTPDDDEPGGTTDTSNATVDSLAVPDAW